MPNLENFVKFYTKVVGQQADARYIRQQIEKLHNPGGPDKEDKDKKRRTKDKDKRRGNEPANLLNTQIEQGAEKDEKDGGKQYKGRYKTSHCLFEDTWGHHSGYCRSPKLTFDEKVAAVKRHGACLLC